MWVVTNIDFEEGAVSDVYGPFKAKAEATRFAKAHAQHEYEDAKLELEGVALVDTLEENGESEVQYKDTNDEDSGCLYQVLELENG